MYPVRTGLSCAPGGGEKRGHANTAQDRYESRSLGWEVREASLKGRIPISLTIRQPGRSLWNEPKTGYPQMVPLYAARVGDLKPGDFVQVECGVCGHDGLIHPAALPLLGLRPDERITDLAPRLRCRECDVKRPGCYIDQMGIGNGDGLF